MVRCLNTTAFRRWRPTAVSPISAGTQDHLIRNQFGGSVGGPIIKDKTFFYFTVESHRLRIGSPLSVNTTTDQFENFVNTGAFAAFMESDPNGICEAYTGTACPGLFSGGAAYPQNVTNATLGPIFVKETNAEPIPICVVGSASCSGTTTTAGGLWTGGLTYPFPVYGTEVLSQPTITNQMRYDTKFDHKLSSKDQLNAAYLYDDVDTTEPYGGGDNVTGPTLYVHGRAQNAGVTWTHTFSPTILNQARMAYVRHTANFPGDPTVAGMPSTISAFDSPTFAIGNSSGIPQLFTENEFIYKDDLSVTKGRHNFKTGAEYRRTRNGSSFDSYKNGLNEDDDIEDVLTDATFTNNWENWPGNPVTHGNAYYGSMYAGYASLNPTTGQLPNYYRGFRANEVAIYGQDDWRVSSRLTVNLGLRWEYFGPPANFQQGLDSNFYTGVPVLQTNPGDNPFWPSSTSGYYASFTTGAVQQRNHAIWNKDLNNFGPRVGFSYDALGNQKLVVRGGFGINYDRIYNNIFENIRFNPPFFAIGDLGALTVGAPITNSIAAALVTYPYMGTGEFLNYPLTPSIRAMDQNLVIPYYEQAHFGFQYQLGKDFVVESNYVGTFGHKLTDIEGRNVYDGKNSAGLDHTQLTRTSATSATVPTVATRTITDSRRRCVSASRVAWSSTRTTPSRRQWTTSATPSLPRTRQLPPTRPTA